MFEQKVLDRFWAKVNKTGTCWVWEGGKTTNGYGQFMIDRKNLRSHRVAYMMSRGDIPKGLVIDHLCRNTSCVNPDHLEAVTQNENVRRSDEILGLRSRKTHCPQGHEYSDDNTYWRPSQYSNGKLTRRFCRECTRAASRRWKEKTDYNEKMRVKK